ncbi:MAG: carboxylating nicotinate-nucleotide diphosphorylase [Planctomycetota bacterium]
MTVVPIEFSPADAEAAAALIRLAWEEDLGPNGDDLTSRLLVPAEAVGMVELKARQAGVLCGVQTAQLVCDAFNARSGAPPIRMTGLLADGVHLSLGAVVARFYGPLRALLTAERTILNFATHLSGIATLTRRFVEAVEGTGAAILDTRKTHPGFRRLEKYAVRCGGGTNHRMGLFDACMAKDNHIAAQPDGDLGGLVRRVKTELPAGAMLIVEVDRLDQFRTVLPAEPDVILLDNMPPDEMAVAGSERNQRRSPVLLEASGGVNLQTVRAIAESGVDRISVGALTHSATALDLGFDWLEGAADTTEAKPVKAVR